MTVNGGDHCPKIEHISLNHAKVRVLRQPFWITDEGSDGVPLSQRLRENQLAGTPCGAEDYYLHFEPSCSFPVVVTTTLYKVGAQPFRNPDI